MASPLSLVKMTLTIEPSGKLAEAPSAGSSKTATALRIGTPPVSFTRMERWAAGGRGKGFTRPSPWRMATVKPLVGGGVISVWPKRTAQLVRERQRVRMQVDIDCFHVTLVDKTRVGMQSDIERFL